MGQHILGSFYLGIMADRWQLGAVVQSALQLFVAGYHMAARHWIHRTID